jgi:hypothetical protein
MKNQTGEVNFYLILNIFAMVCVAVILAKPCTHKVDCQPEITTNETVN